MTDDNRELGACVACIDELRRAAHVAVRQALVAENTACYWDGGDGSTDAARAACNAALTAIDTLAHAVNLGTAAEHVDSWEESRHRH